MNERRAALDFNERVFTLADVKAALKRKKQWIQRCAWIGALLGASAALFSQPSYKIGATFKEGVEKEGEGMLKDLFGGLTGMSDQPQAAVLLKSNPVVHPLVERLGLQAEVLPQIGSVNKWLQRAKENISAERGRHLPDLDPFLFSHLSYRGEETKKYCLRFEEGGLFSIWSADRKKELAQGVVGKSLSWDEITLTLSKTPASLRLKKFYPLQIAPLLSKAEELKGKLIIESHKVNKSISNLSLTYRDRSRGVTLLNEWMNEYQRYLKREHDLVAESQLSYLEGKQRQLLETIETVLTDYTAYLNHNILEKGIIGMGEQGNRAILQPYQELQDRLLKVGLELSWLQQGSIGGGGKLFSSDSLFGQQLHQLTHKVKELHQQKDLLKLSLSEKQLPLFDPSQWEAKKGELLELQRSQASIGSLLKSLETGGEPPLSFDLPQGLLVWAERLSSSTSLSEKVLFAQSLREMAHLLSLQEKALQERLSYAKNPSFLLEGIDLETAKQVLLDYNAKIDESEMAIVRYQQLQKELQRDDFELSSLGAFLKDPFSLQLIDASNRIGLQLKDERYRSTKEEKRWQDELNWQKKIFSDHLSQLTRVEEMQKALLREKLEGIQQFLLELIQRQITVSQEQIEEAVGEKRESLVKEQKILNTKVDELLHMALDLPERWRLHEWFKLKSEMAMKMIGTIAQLVESKTISHHLHHVESKPVDAATLPFAPKSPRLFLLSFLGTVFASLGGAFYALLLPLFQGFPLSKEQLEALGLPYLGALSPSCNGLFEEAPSGPDLDLLRKVSLFLKQPEEAPLVTALFLGKGPNYTPSLANTLSRTSEKPLLLSCDFSSPFYPEEGEGLLSLAEGGRPQIQSHSTFDWVSAGGYTPFGAEILQSKPFLEFLEEMKGRYSHIFLLFRSPLESAESLLALSLAHKALITVCGEEAEVLTPFVKWAYDGGRCRLQFITAKPCR